MYIVYCIFTVAWLNIEKDKGFHSGTIEAVDRDENKYWVTFDKQGKQNIYMYLYSINFDVHVSFDIHVQIVYTVVQSHMSFTYIICIRSLRKALSAFINIALTLIDRKHPKLLYNEY